MIVGATREQFRAMRDVDQGNHLGPAVGDVDRGVAGRVAVCGDGADARRDFARIYD